MYYYLLFIRRGFHANIVLKTKQHDPELTSRPDDLPLTLRDDLNMNEQRTLLRFLDSNKQ